VIQRCSSGCTRPTLVRDWPPSMCHPPGPSSEPDVQLTFIAKPSSTQFGSEFPHRRSALPGDILAKVGAAGGRRHGNRLRILGTSKTGNGEDGLRMVHISRACAVHWNDRPCLTKSSPVSIWLLRAVGRHRAIDGNSHAAAAERKLIPPSAEAKSLTLSPNFISLTSLPQQLPQQVSRLEGEAEVIRCCPTTVTFLPSRSGEGPAD
jgi:hypothetical protein